MIALMSFTPTHCPHCGHDFKEWDTYERQDWFAGCSHTCKGCGLHFAYADGRRLLEVAGEHGDMTRYVTPAEVA